MICTQLRELRRLGALVKVGRRFGARNSFSLSSPLLNVSAVAMAARTGKVVTPSAGDPGRKVRYYTVASESPVTPSIVARFKAAHAPAAAAAGLSREQIAAEAVLFDTPSVWKLMKKQSYELGCQQCEAVAASLQPSALFLAQACRFRVTALSPADVRSVCVAADALARLEVLVQASDEDAVAAALAPLSSIDAPAEELASMLVFALDAPRRSDAFAFCVNHDVVVVVRAGLNLDVEKLRRACRRTLAHPTPAERCFSRSLCVWCGASPFSDGVTLHACQDCACISYCSEECRLADSFCEHSRECGDTSRSSAPSYGAPGAVTLAEHEVGLTRADTGGSNSKMMEIATLGMRCGGKRLSLWLEASITNEGK